MSNLQVSTVPSMPRMALRTLLGGVVIFAAILLFLGPRAWSGIAAGFASSQLHAPRVELISRSPAVIQVHLWTVLAAFAVATAQMAAPKGTTAHRILGWTLVTLFLATAIDSLFIRNPGGGLFNPFQIFSVWTLIGIPLAVAAIRRGNVALHARLMTGFYFGSLIIAGALTFLPGRLLWRVFFG